MKNINGCNLTANCTEICMPCTGMRIVPGAGFVWASVEDIVLTDILGSAFRDWHGDAFSLLIHAKSTEFNLGLT